MSASVSDAGVLTANVASFSNAEFLMSGGNLDSNKQLNICRSAQYLLVHGLCRYPSLGESSDVEDESEGSQCVGVRSAKPNRRTSALPFW